MKVADFLATTQMLNLLGEIKIIHRRWWRKCVRRVATLWDKICRSKLLLTVGFVINTRETGREEAVVNVKQWENFRIIWRRVSNPWCQTVKLQDHQEARRRACVFTSMKIRAGSVSVCAHTFANEVFSLRACEFWCFFSLSLCSSVVKFLSIFSSGSCRL